MHLQLIDWIIIGFYLILSISIGIYYRARASRSTQNFFLSGRKLPWYIAGTSMVATTFAADTPLAVTELVWQNGIAGNWLWWNMLLGGIMTVYFFSHLWRRAQITTDAEFVTIRYSGPPAHFLRGFRAIYIGLFMNTIVIAWVNLAMVKILQVFFPDLTFFGMHAITILDIEISSHLLYVGILLLFVILYTSLSGLMGVAITDSIQFLIAMTGSILLAVFAVQNAGGINAVVDFFADKQHILQFFPSLSDSNLSQRGVLRMSIVAFVAYLGVQWWASWYPGAEPGGGGYVAQRMMAAKNEKHAFLSTLWFQIAHYALRPWPWIVVALVTMMMYPQATDKGATYVMLARDIMPAGLLGLLLAAFFAAYMSTIASQTVWGTSYIINDFFKPIKSDKPDTYYVKFARLTTVLLIVFSLVVTTQFHRISDAWRFVLVMSSGIGPVLLLRWYWWRINAWSEIAAMIAPYIFYPVLRYGLKLQPITEDFEICLILNVIWSSCIWIAVTFLTKPTDETILKKFYEKIQPDGPGWNKFHIHKTKNNLLLKLLLCWLTSSLLLIMTIFITGKIILQQFQYLVFGMIAWVFMLFMVVRLIKQITKNNIFEKQ